MSLQHDYPEGYVQSSQVNPVRLHTENQDYDYEVDNQPLLDLLGNDYAIDIRLSTLETNLGSFAVNGQLQNDLNLGSYKVVNMADPESATDAVSLGYLNSVFDDGAYVHITENEEITGIKSFNDPIIGQLTDANAFAFKIAARYDNTVAANEHKAMVITTGEISDFDVIADPTIPIIADTNIIKIGEGSADSNITLIFRTDRTATENPSIRYNYSTTKLQYTNDGSTWYTMDSLVSDSAVVHNTTDEDVAGVKKFTDYLFGYGALSYPVAYKISPNNPSVGVNSRLMIETGALNGYDLDGTEITRNLIPIDICPISVRFGRGVAEDIYLKFRNGTSDTLPGFRYQQSSTSIQWSANGSSWYTLLPWTQAASVTAVNSFTSSFDSGDSAATRATLLNQLKDITNNNVTAINAILTALKNANIMLP